MDDMMHLIVSSVDVQLLFTQGAHHRKLTVIYLNQNLYCQGRCACTISLNSHYILLRNPRDASQVQCLGKQIVPGKGKVVTEAYNDCMSNHTVI